MGFYFCFYSYATHIRMRQDKSLSPQNPACHRGSKAEYCTGPPKPQRAAGCCCSSGFLARWQRPSAEEHTAALTPCRLGTGPATTPLSSVQQTTTNQFLQIIRECKGAGKRQKGERVSVCPNVTDHRWLIVPKIFLLQYLLANQSPTSFIG